MVRLSQTSTLRRRTERQSRSFLSSLPQVESSQMYVDRSGSIELALTQL